MGVTQISLLYPVYGGLINAKNSVSGISLMKSKELAVRAKIIDYRRLACVTGHLVLSQVLVAGPVSPSVRCTGTDQAGVRLSPSRSG